MRNIICTILYKLYAVKSRIIKHRVLTFIRKIEGEDAYSLTLRKIFKDYHKVDVGMYTWGGCFHPGQIDKHTTIGRYSSIARTAWVMNRNHPINHKSSCALFFNPACGLTKKDNIEYIPLTIGNDVWIGHNACIMPHVRNIGDGAIVAAGAIVNKDVPPYAIVVGNPARVVRYRFSEKVIAELLSSKWWEKTIEEILPNIQEYQRPYEEQDTRPLEVTIKL